MSIHERLKAARERHFATATEAAKAMGVNTNTYAAHENGSRGFGRAAAAQYAAKYGVTLDYLLTGKQVVMEKPDQVMVSSTKVGGIPVKGFVRAGIWQESYRPERDKSLPIPKDLRYLGRDQFALEVQGESMNRRVKPGAYVVCVPFDGNVPNDKMVIVERSRAGVFEATIKVVRIGVGRRVELWPDSDHPDHQEPTVLDGDTVKDGEEIAITAKVIGVYTPE